MCRVVQYPTTVEAGVIMRALEPEVVDVLWEAVRHLVPVRVDRHPRGGHRPPSTALFLGDLAEVAADDHFHVGADTAWYRQEHPPTENPPGNPYLDEL